MDQTLIDLRQQEIEASNAFLKAQRAYLKAAAPNSRKSEAELKELATTYLKAAEPYGAALEALRQHLLAAEQTETIIAELEQTERLLYALSKEEQASSELIEHYMELIDRGVTIKNRADEDDKSS